MLITEQYLNEQKHLHFGSEKQNRKYGTGGPPFAEMLINICAEHGITELLDYGCGKAVLRSCLDGIAWRGYDPALEEYSALPEACDLVVCLDVLEHIEPECLNDVLDHLKVLARKLLFVSISLKKAGRFLSDGRNAHLIIESADWWREQIERRGFPRVQQFATEKAEYVALFEAA